MTRFARAKGSKASNERVPEQATSWAEMKEQLNLKNKEIEDAKKREEFMNQRNANYKAFLDERALENKKSEWSIFPNANKGKSNMSNGVSSHKKRKNSFNSMEFDDISSNDETYKDLKSKVDSVLNVTEFLKGNSDSPANEGSCKNKKKNKNKKMKSSLSKDESCPDKSKENQILSKDFKHEMDKTLGNKKFENESDSDAPPDEESSKKEVPAPIVKEKKIKKKKLKILVDQKIKDGTVKKDQDFTKKSETENVNKSKKKKKRKIVEEENKDNKIEINENVTNEQPSEKKNLKKKGTNSSLSISNQPEKKSKENLTEQVLKKIEKKKQKRIKQLEKKKKMKEQLKKEKLSAEQSVPVQVLDSSPSKDLSKDVHKNRTSNSNVAKDNNNFRDPTKFNKAEKRPPKIRDREEHKRKKPYLPHKMFINGKEVEVDYVDGFPVKKEDADRLKKLRKDMIAKGLPGSEIKISLKLERRKAEKAFAREKKKVCFNCRKSGHNLSECPEVGKSELSQNLASGICFKCGSTEHTHFECKVVKGQQFNYAQCFICNEQGHISRQCPDNTRGLYPKGGSCNVCGDVTHLKRDCPQYQAQQQRHESSIQIETFGDGNPDVLDQNSAVSKFPVNRKQNKIIKF
nr:ankyrin repeat domain-containing protein 12-like [Leptinotarsa decemlineata]